MTIDFNAILQQLQHVDLTSAAIGAVAARAAEAAIIKAIKPLPAMAVGLLKKRVLALRAAGKLDEPTMKLLKAYAKATFDWVDAELPDSPGPEKMDAALDKLSALPYLGVIVRADREGIRQVMQAAYDAIDAEAKAQAAALKEGAPDAQATHPSSGGAAAGAPTPAPAPAPPSGS